MSSINKLAAADYISLPKFTNSIGGIKQNSKSAVEVLLIFVLALKI